MKNYGDPLSNCNDNMENTRNLNNPKNEKPLSDVATLPKVNN